MYLTSSWSSTANVACQQTCNAILKESWQNLIRKLNKQGGYIGGKGKHKKEVKNGTAKIKTLRK